jgi:hypothetical protein
VRALLELVDGNPPVIYDSVEGADSERTNIMTSNP